MNIQKNILHAQKKTIQFKHRLLWYFCLKLLFDNYVKALMIVGSQSTTSDIKG